MILKALRQAYSDDSRLKTTPLEEVSRQLIIRGYLPGSFSPALRAGVEEVMETVNRRPGSPTLWPCQVEVYWDEEWHDNLQDELYASVEWGEFRAPWEERTMPEKLTRTRTPPCTDLISESEDVLRNKSRWPIHVCSFQFLGQSTRLWAEAHSFVGESMNTLRWAYMHPLPIGRRALMKTREVDDLLEWSEVLSVLPFAGHECALWALRVEAQGSVLDLFALEDYPTELHKKIGIPVAGDLAYVLRGRDTSVIDLVDKAKRWWAHFRGRALRGRPRGSGTWEIASEFEETVRKVVGRLREQGYKATQGSVAENLGCDDRVLRYWIKRFGLDWNDLLKAP